ncbi:MAG: hypothetical protein AAF447_23940, partial [Myxococcota bacterium]
MARPQRVCFFVACLVAVACGGDAPVAPGDAGTLDLAEPPAWPATLAQAGLYAEGISGPLAEGMRRYEVRHRFSHSIVTRRHSR